MVPTLDATTDSDARLSRGGAGQAPGMTEQPWLIPYVDHYSGATRVLTLDLTSGNSMVVDKHRPIVSIDGRQYVVVWGPVSFEIPAERNVHVSVHLHGNVVGQVASLLLPPGGPVALRYATHYTSGVGSLTPIAAAGQQPR
jgi:hypothetical protein